MAWPGLISPAMKCALLCIISEFCCLSNSLEMCYPSGEQSVWMLSGWQAGYLSMLLQIFSSTAALSLATVCLCMRCFKSCLLTVHRAFLSPAMAFIPSAGSLNQCSVAQWTDLNWLIQGNTGVVTSASPACLRKTAPQHTLLYSSKCKKPLWVRRA